MQRDVVLSSCWPLVSFAANMEYFEINLFYFSNFLQKSMSSNRRNVSWLFSTMGGYREDCYGNRVGWEPLYDLYTRSN